MDRDIALSIVTAITDINGVLDTLVANTAPTVETQNNVNNNRSDVSVEEKSDIIEKDSIDEIETEPEPEPEPEPVTKKSASK